MLIALPLLCFGLIFFSLHVRRDTDDPRRAFIDAAIVWGLVLTAITEVLSLVRALTLVWVSGAWGVVCMVSIFVLLRRRRAATSHSGPKRPQIPFSLSLLLLGVAAITAVVGVTAVFAAPNSWDAMTYHFSRVMHWIQDRSVAHYPTSILEQLYWSPWAEYAVLHLQLLSGEDHFANLVQWFSMVGSIVGISLVAQQLEATPRGGIFAAVAVATIPMGILQGSSAVTDYVVAFWLVCLASYVLRVARNEGPPARLALGTGGSLGLALLSKGTAYIFALPFLLWLVFVQRRTSLGTVWRAGTLIIAITLATNAGYYLRNIDLFGSPLGLNGTRQGVGLGNDVHAIPGTISNIIRNLSFHVATHRPRVNAIIERGIRSLVRLVGANPDDPKTSLAPLEVSSSILAGGLAGNPLHLLLIAASIILLLGFWKRKERAVCVGYSVVLVAAFLLFSVLVKWQPWGSRLELPLFVLGAPLIGVLLSTLPRRIPGRVATSILTVGYGVALLGAFHLFSVTLNWHPWGSRLGLIAMFVLGAPLVGALLSTLLRHDSGHAIAAVLIIVALPWVFLNESHPLLGNDNIFRVSRSLQYFRSNDADRGPYTGAVRFISGHKCAQVGLESHIAPFPLSLPWEYPLWVLFQDTPMKVRLEHVNVENVSAAEFKVYPFNHFNPCAILAFEPKDLRKDILTNGYLYVREWSEGPVSVFVRRPPSASARSFRVMSVASDDARRRASVR